MNQRQFQEKTLYVWLEEWYQDSGSKGVRPNTSQCYRYTIRIMHKWFPDAPLTKIDEAAIQEAFDFMADIGRSKSQIQKVRFVLHQIFKLAVRKGALPYDPTGFVKLPSNAPEREIHPLSPEQQQRVETACKDDLHGDLILFLLYTGLRLSELCGLKWRDFDKQRRELHIRESKTGAGVRTIPLLPESAAIILLQPRVNDFIFNSARTKQPVTPSVMRRTYLRLREAAGVPELTNHVCRHTFATRLVECDASPKAVAALLGHANVAFTMQRYVKAQPAFLRQQLSLLAEQAHHALWS